MSRGEYRTGDEALPMGGISEAFDTFPPLPSPPKDRES